MESSQNGFCYAFRGWRVVVTGHSLGAGASVLVALYLRNYFRNVYCWAFSPPGGLAEPSVAEAARSFCTSVALGKDWIPRLTLGSFEHLRDEMVRAPSLCLSGPDQPVTHD